MTGRIPPVFNNFILILGSSCYAKVSGEAQTDKAKQTCKTPASNPHLQQQTWKGTTKYASYEILVQNCGSRFLSPQICVIQNPDSVLSANPATLLGKICHKVYHEPIFSPYSG